MSTLSRAMKEVVDCPQDGYQTSQGFLSLRATAESKEIFKDPNVLSPTGTELPDSHPSGSPGELQG